MHRAVDQPEAADEDGQHNVEQREIALQAQTEQAAAWHRLQAIFAACEGRLQKVEVHHLRQGQRDHRKVDARAADRQQAEQEPQQGRAADPKEQPHRHRQAPDLDGLTGAVCGQAEEGRMPEAEQAGEADQQVEGAGKQRKAHQLHRKDRVHAQHRQRRDNQEHQRIADQRILHAHQRSLPKRPAGRTSSTTAITTKTTVFEASG